jgi:hypothetical protein
MTHAIHEFSRPQQFDFGPIARSSLFTDCTITLSSGSLRSHRLLLAASSPVLSAHFCDDSVTSLSLPGVSLDAFQLFLTLLHTSRIPLSLPVLPSVLRVACDLECASLFSVCADFVDEVSSRRTVLALLRDLAFAVHRLPGFLKFAAALIEALNAETDFAFLSADQFKLLISRARFTTPYARDEVIRKYLAGTGTEEAAFAEFERPMPGVLEDTIERAAYSAVFICAPPDPGLLRSLAAQVVVTSSGMATARDPASIIDEAPARHWYTESDDNAWVTVEFTELYIQPTDYGIWSHFGASTLRNWTLHGSNDMAVWVVLSSHRDDESIRDPGSAAIWPVNTNGFFKYFRIMQTGNNWSGNRWMYLLKVEIWGVACQMEL